MHPGSGRPIRVPLMAAAMLISLTASCERGFGDRKVDPAEAAQPLRKGAHWRQVSVLPGLASVSGSRSTAFDSQRGRLVLVQQEDYTSLPQLKTWEWDGEQWADRTSIGPAWPSGQIGWTAYDNLRGRVVYLAYTNCGGSTWEWDGSSWTLRDEVGPTLYGFIGQQGTADMTFDNARGRVVWSGLIWNVDETWEWDGSRWERRSVSRGRGRMAFDRIRQRVVAFDGSTMSEWDGTTWTERLSVTTPGSGTLGYDPDRDVWVMVGAATWEFSSGAWAERGPAPAALPASFTGRHVVEYDAAQKRMVLLTDDGHAEWDGASWTTRVVVPPPRRDHAMAFDEARREVIMLGGNGSLTGAVLDDMWTWDGSLWRKRSVPLPPARAGHAMAYDRNRQRVVVFGGSGRADTWEWDGINWQERSVLGPEPRGGLAMAYDSVRRVVLLFTGFDMWTWDGTSWTQVASETVPPLREGRSMAFDDSRGVAVLVGSYEAQFAVQDETWEWDGTTWTQRQPDWSPLAQSRPGIAYDSARQLIVVFGGNRWLEGAAEWDGTEWSLGSSPGARLGAALAYDATRRSLVTFGGVDRFFNRRGTRSTWETVLEGVPCVSTADCSSGTCVDGVCCNTQESSCGECSRCDVPGSVGTCTPSDGLPCSDGDACTVNDRCVGGACVPQYRTVCVTQDECNPANGCHPTTGECMYEVRPDRTPCFDGGWQCRGGQCINLCKVHVCRESGCVYEDWSCPPTPCFVPDACDPYEGCVGRSLDDGTPCKEPNWGDPGRCMGGACQRIEPCEGLANGASCVDGHPPQLGRCRDGYCEWINPCEGAVDDTPCPSVIDDPRAVCRSGNCQVPFECTSEFCGADTECRVLRECVDAGCVFEDLHGTPCSAGFCRDGFCQPDLCVGLVCPLNDCIESSSCDPLTGGCSYELKPDGTSCDDKNACTRVDTCVNGWCSGMDPVSCEQPTPWNPCVPLVVCDPATGRCPEIEPPADAGMPPIDAGSAGTGAMQDAGSAGDAAAAGGSAGQSGSAGTPEAGSSGERDAGVIDAGDPGGHAHGHKPRWWHCAMLPAARASNPTAPLFAACLAMIVAVRMSRRRSRIRERHP